MKNLNNVNSSEQAVAQAAAPSMKTSLRKQKGASAIEYAVIVAVIVLGVWAAVSAAGLSTAVSGFFADVAAVINPPD